MSTILLDTMFGERSVSVAGHAEPRLVINGKANTANGTRTRSLRLERAAC